MTIPVVFIHFGACEHLPVAVAQAQRRGNPTYVLGDRELAACDDAQKFAVVYQHLSMNHYAFELACFQRWFVLRDWMRGKFSATGSPVCLYLDSDVLLYANASAEWEFYKQFNFTLALGTTAHTSFWHYTPLDAFCEFLLRTYDDRPALFAEMERIYAEMRAQNLAGGISDMFMLKAFAQTGWNVGEMCEICNGATWDHNINASDNFRMENGCKEIRMLDGTPFGFLETGEPIRFKSLHFQGGAKSLMPQYAYDAERMPQ